MAIQGWLTRERPILMGLGAAVLVGVSVWQLLRVGKWWMYAPAVGWIAAGLVYLVLMWGVVVWRNPEQTKSHAELKRWTRLLHDLIVVSASIASVGGVAHLLIAGSTEGAGKSVIAGVGVGCIVVSWFAVHTVFSLRYAHMYYRSDPPRGIGFKRIHGEQPAYLDFFYVGFTIGMAYQVSDTDLQSRRFRATALGQALLSYLLGAVILAITINLIASLMNSHG